MTMFSLYIDQLTNHKVNANKLFSLTFKIISNTVNYFFIHYIQQVIDYYKYRNSKGNYTKQNGKMSTVLGETKRMRNL